jgi:hypothetical protein
VIVVRVPHIEDVKYKGLQPTLKKETIKNINLMIDKFNEFNAELIDYYIIEKLIQKPDNLVQAFFPGHRNYLLKFIEATVEAMRKKMII